MDISRIEDLIFRMAVRLEAMQAITYEKEWKPEVDEVRKMLWNAKPVSSEVAVPSVEELCKVYNKARYPEGINTMRALSGRAGIEAIHDLLTRANDSRGGVK